MIEVYGMVFLLPGPGAQLCPPLPTNDTYVYVHILYAGMKMVTTRIQDPRGGHAASPHATVFTAAYIGRCYVQQMDSRCNYLRDRKDEHHNVTLYTK